MAGVKSDISLQIENNLNRNVKFSILGGTQDPSNGQANARTIYEWDLSAETFANTTVLSIEASTVTNPTVITYEVSNQDGAITDLETVVRLLNTLNLGVFNLDGNVVWIVDDINVFGNLEVLVSLTFDINTFVTSAYNYFDPLGQTSLPSFIARWQPAIQQAVNTVPNFVSNIDTIGWQLAYPITERVTLQRSVSGDGYVVTSASTTLYAGITSISQFGTGDAIVYVSDLTIWSGVNLFRLDANAVNDNYIFKYIADGNNITFEADDPVAPSKSWLPLDSSNFPSYTGNNTFIRLNDVNQLNLINAFPSIAVLDNSGLTFSQIPTLAGDIDLNPVGGVVDFGGYPITLGDSASISLTRLIESGLSVITLDFSTFNKSGQNHVIDIKQGFLGVQDFVLSSEFNTKFTYPSGQSGNGFTLRGEGFASSFPTIQFADDVTPLTLNFAFIDFNATAIINLPPLNFVGYLQAPNTYFLNLNISTYTFGGGAFNTQFYNDWLGKLGSQAFLNTEPISTMNGGLNITASTNYTLSGRGVSGYYALVEQGLAVFINAFTILTNSFSFTLSSGGSCLVQTFSAIVTSSFDIDISEKGQAVFTQPSVASPPPFTEEVDFGVVANETDCIISSTPTAPCTEFFIGKNPSFIGQDDTLSNLVIGNGVFGQNLGVVTISGLTLTFDIDINNQGGAYGLYNRDFSGLDSTVCSELNFENLVINCIKVAPIVGFPFNVEPYGSTAFINIPTVNPIQDLIFTDCVFGIANPITDNNFRPLNVLFDVGAVNNLGIFFNGCLFGLNNLPSSVTEVYFAINDDDGGTPRNALLGSSTIQDCQFSTVGFDKLIFEANYNGVGNNFSSLQINNNPNLQSVRLSSVGGSTPPASSITLGVNNVLEEFQFTDYNLTTLFVALPNLPACRFFQVFDNDLNSASLDQILLALDNNGITNGVLDYSNQTGGASPNIGVSGVAYNNLILKGWGVTGNVPI